MQGLVDIPNEMEEVACHEGSLEGDAVFVCLEDALTPVDDVDCIHVLLILRHALEGKIGVVGSASSW